MDVRKALLAPIALLLVTGCTGSGPAAQGPATLPPLTSPSASPSPTVVALPPEATPDTPQAAGAFARFYLRELATAGQTGDVSVLRRYSEAACDTCNNLISAIEQNAKAETLLKGGAIKVLSAEASMTTPGDAIVDVLYAREAAVRTQPNGQIAESAAPVARDLMQLRVVRPQNGWLVRGLRFPEVPQ